MLVDVTLLWLNDLIFLKKLPCLCRLMSSSISFIISLSHFSLSSLIALLTLLRHLLYCFCLFSSLHTSCHLWKAMRFSSISSRVSAVIHVFLTGLLLCRCCVAAFTIASFISIHLSSTLPCPFLLSNCCWMVSRYSPRLSAYLRSSTSKHLPGLPFALLFSFRCRDTITNRWSLSMSPPLYTPVSSTDGLSLCLTRI